MSASDDDRTASLMTPARLAQLQVRPAAGASPAAWLDQMAADAGSGHVRRLLELRQQLEAQVRAHDADFEPVAAACQAWHDALGALDFSLVQPKGWLARAAGKGKEAAAGFSTQHAKAQSAGEDLADEARALKKRLAASEDRLVLEIGTELRALEKIMDQGARWLQDMRNQLKARQAEGPDAAQQEQIAQDNARCELLVERLKLLRTVNGATQQALEHCRSAAARRADVQASLQPLLDEEGKAAGEALAGVARQVEARRAAAEGVEPAEAAVRSLQSALQQAVQDCSDAQALVRSAADEVAALQASLQAAA